MLNNFIGSVNWLQVRKITMLAVLQLSLFNIAFSRNNGTYTDTSKLSCLTNASHQLNEALLLMQQHYYKKDNVQWDSLVQAARARLTVSSSCEEAYQTLDWCFRQLSEAHSFLMPAQKAAVYNNSPGLQQPNLRQLVGEIKGELMTDKGIAYLTVPWVGTTDPAVCTYIADSLQHLIASLDAQGVSKWIIDLRQNSGGNCWPMLAGIGPLLGNGTCGYFVSGAEKVPIGYTDGAAMQGRNVRCRVSFPAYKIKNSNSLVAVLTGPHTSSSGEIIALAFKGKAQATLYGEPTAGFTTANTTYTLSDKSMLVLTVCQEADRFGRLVEGKIFPDEMITPDNHNSLDDAVKSAAIMWLHIQ